MGENVTVKLESLEKIERDGVFKRKCAGVQTWLPEKIDVRCAPVQAPVNNFVAHVVHASKYGNQQGDLSNVPEDDTDPKSLHAIEEAEADKKETPVEILTDGEFEKKEEKK